MYHIVTLQILTINPCPAEPESVISSLENSVDAKIHDIHGCKSMLYIVLCFPGNHCTINIGHKYINVLETH